MHVLNGRHPIVNIPKAFVPGSQDRKEHDHLLESRAFAKLTTTGAVPLGTTSSAEQVDGFVQPRELQEQMRRDQGRGLAWLHSAGNKTGLGVFPIIQRFIDALRSRANLAEPVELPKSDRILLCDTPGLARLFSLPRGKDFYQGHGNRTTKVLQGILNNPASDVRTTEGIKHFAAGLGPKLPSDGIAVPLAACLKLLKAALDTSRSPELFKLPYAQSPDWRQTRDLWVGLALRTPVEPPLVGVTRGKWLEHFYLCPADLVCIPDFLENVFGNAGDPFDPATFGSLDPTVIGHSLTIFAPHLVGVSKKELDLPYTSQDEKYNDGKAFKIELRGSNDPAKGATPETQGIMVNVVAERYQGYGKKGNKANLSKKAERTLSAEEEHAGGAVVYVQRVHGLRFVPSAADLNGHSYRDFVRFSDHIEWNEKEGFGVDKKFPKIFYIPEDAEISILTKKASWRIQGPDGESVEKSLKLDPKAVYIRPNGSALFIEKYKPNKWRIVQKEGRGNLVHKPCTVSGGGKSEISKKLVTQWDNLTVTDWSKTFTDLREILFRDYRSATNLASNENLTTFLDPKLSVSDASRFLIPYSHYTPEHLHWLASLSSESKWLAKYVMTIFRNESGANEFANMPCAVHVQNIINRLSVPEGSHAVHYLDSKIKVETFEFAGKRHRLRPDKTTVAPLQIEDDITASVTLPLKLIPRVKKSRLFEPYQKHIETAPSVKFVLNTEFRLFQRPDDAIFRGRDKQTEKDFSSHDEYFVNFEPVGQAEAEAIQSDFIRMGEYSEPLRQKIESAVTNDEFKEAGTKFMVLTDEPRKVVKNGKEVRSTNPRYLQLNPLLANPSFTHICEIGERLYYGHDQNETVLWPVALSMPAQRLNTHIEDGGKVLESTAAFSVVHSLPRITTYLNWFVSMTGKSASKSGATGKEGSLTKGPFDPLPGTIGLNRAFRSDVLTGMPKITTTAGPVGENYDLGHEVTMLMQQAVAFLSPEELRANGGADFIKAVFEPVADIDYEDPQTHEIRRVPASVVLGSRITRDGAIRLLHPFVDDPNVFTEELLHPERQDHARWIEAVENIWGMYQEATRTAIKDGTAEYLDPPLKALFHIVAEGEYRFKRSADDQTEVVWKMDTPEFQEQFTLNSVLNSDWYRKALELGRDYELQHLKGCRENILKMLKADVASDQDLRKQWQSNLAITDEMIKEREAADFIERVKGMTGATSF